jgi:hypothetical protein
MGLMKKTAFVMSMLTAMLVALPGRAQTSSPQAGATLAISGYTGRIAMVQVNGKSYVSVEDLARLTQGSLSFGTNQIVLTLPGAAAAAPATPPGFSTGFLQAAIEEMSVIRDWRSGIVAGVQNNTPISDAWAASEHRKAQTNRALMAAAVSTDDDRSALALITGQFANMLKLSDQVLATRGQAQYIDPGSIANDPLNLQLQTCARSLTAMATANKFQDEPACH